MSTHGSSFPALLTRRHFAAGLAGSLALLPGLALAGDGLKGGDSSDQPDEDVSPEFEDIGVVSEDTYVSPQFGYEITWQKPWEVDPLDIGESNPGEEFDTLYLSWMVGSTTVGMIDLTGIAANRRDAQVFFKNMQTDQSVSDMLNNKYEAAIAISSTEPDALEMVIFATELDDPDTSIVLLCVYRMISDDVMTLATAMVVDSATIGELVSAYSGDIEVDGSSILQDLSARDVFEALAEFDPAWGGED